MLASVECGLEHRRRAEQPYRLPVGVGIKPRRVPLAQGVVKVALFPDIPTGLVHPAAAQTWGEKCPRDGGAVQLRARGLG